jgi:hypothetical protein
MCWNEREHRDNARKDARYGRKDYEEYDRHSDDPCKQAYTEEYDRERRHEEERHQEARMEEERQERQQAQAVEQRRYEQEMEESRYHDEQRQSQEDVPPEQPESSNESVEKVPD